jgi:hypothetical protein
MNIPDHLLHFTPGMYGGSYRLECLPHGEHFTADIEEWSGTADKLEAEGVTVDRTTCWVHDWLDVAGDFTEFMRGNDWTEDGPWPVICSYNNGLDVEMAVRE